LRSDIVILLFCTFGVEVQGKFAGLSMEWFSPLFSEIEHDIDLIISINRNRNISLTKGCAKDIISPVGCNSHVRKRGLHVGPSSGAKLHYGLPRMMVVPGGLGVLVGWCLGAVCLAVGMAGVVGTFLDASCSLISFVCAR
jgi:hypothetical protein